MRKSGSVAVREAGVVVREQKGGIAGGGETPGGWICSFSGWWWYFSSCIHMSDCTKLYTLNIGVYSVLIIPQ